ncbi:BnaC06g10620D [Brassica napus]|uniref:BnaC06g10620D protein n=1 Tax=Brassica napus TaxID=3708 RepID=A0A078GLM0_BRANA|nr:BnaC06g10620D [Brassica napus]
MDYASRIINPPKKPSSKRFMITLESFVIYGVTGQTIPHYYSSVDKLMGLRSQLNSFREASGGKRIPVNDLVVKAFQAASCNSSWTDDYIRQFQNAERKWALCSCGEGRRKVCLQLEKKFGYWLKWQKRTAVYTAILAVGSAEKRVVRGNCDHRVVDSAIGAEWLKTFKGIYHRAP